MADDELYDPSTDEFEDASDGEDETVIRVTEDELEALEREAEWAQERDEAESLIQEVFDGSAALDGAGGSAGSNSGSTTTLSLLERLLLSRILGSRGGLSTQRAEEEEQEEEAEEDDDDDYRWGYGSRRQQQPTWFPSHKEPQAAGVELLNSGAFGRPDRTLRKRNFTSMVLDRSDQIGPFHRQTIGRMTIPNSTGAVVARYSSPVYAGQYSEDSSFFYTCCRDFTINIYDTTAPLQRTLKPTPTRRRRRLFYGGLDEYDGIDHETSLKHVKTINGIEGAWTITDSDLSDDNNWMIYSSITPTVHLVSTREGESEQQYPLHFSGHEGYDPGYGSGIWSVRFSSDGKEIVAGAQDGEIYVYDIEARQRTLDLQGHRGDVNAVCFADTGSGNVLISGSDDRVLKVWDRRSLAGGKTSGVLVGHTEGITFVSPKGDGRYAISNGKDQALRLWDIRRLVSIEDFDDSSQIDPPHFYSIRGYDYRRGFYPKPKYDSHPNDCSVMTYRGHAVMHTLIRCHFSPAATTGQRYIYSGSSDGNIHIWSLDGRVVQTIDRSTTLPLAPPAGPGAVRTPHDPSAPDPVALPRGTGRSRAVVRDVSWHAWEPSLMSTAWESGELGSVAKHEWKGVGKLAGGLEDWVEQQREDAMGL